MTGITISQIHLGLIGWPLGHSYSPRLHQAALKALELQGEYLLYPVPPLPQGADLLANLLTQARQGHLQGLNVTIPHKQTVIPFLDDVTPVARTIGAVNTIFLQGDRLIGDNTDAPGFLADLKRLAPELFSGEKRRALILGAGGSARAVVYALARAGWEIIIAARRLEKAEEIAASLQNFSDSEIALTLSPSIAGLDFSLLVNTTPVGMHPNITASPWPDEVPLPKGIMVYDLVYNPPVTALVRAARLAKLKAANGIGMLVEQAALAFEIWLGRNAPRQAMWDAITLDQEKL
jgi:shikimate dehydrogenase